MKFVAPMLSILRRRDNDSAPHPHTQRLRTSLHLKANHRLYSIRTTFTFPLTHQSRLPKYPVTKKLGIHTEMDSAAKKIGSRLFVRNALDALPGTLIGPDGETTIEAKPLDISPAGIGVHCYEEFDVGSVLH